MKAGAQPGPSAVGDTWRKTSKPVTDIQEDERPYPPVLSIGALELGSTVNHTERLAQTLPAKDDVDEVKLLNFGAP